MAEITVLTLYKLIQSGKKYRLRVSCSLTADKNSVKQTGRYRQIFNRKQTNRSQKSTVPP
jgi:hypothetical protein